MKRVAVQVRIPPCRNILRWDSRAEIQIRVWVWNEIWMTGRQP
jgi:hypothetical protein